MNDNVYTVVGLGHGTSKRTNKEYFTLHVTSENDYVNGVVAENFFLSDKFKDDFFKLVVGCKLELYFNTVDGRRYVAKIIIKSFPK